MVVSILYRNSTQWSNRLVLLHFLHKCTVPRASRVSGRSPPKGRLPAEEQSWPLCWAASLSAEVWAEGWASFPVGFCELGVVWESMCVVSLATT